METASCSKELFKLSFNPRHLFKSMCITVLGEPYKGKWELSQLKEDGVIQDLHDGAKLALRKRSDLETELEFIFSLTNHQIGSIAFTGSFLLPFIQ